MPDVYDPSDWYWQDDGGRIYASARYLDVAQDDADLTSWLDRGNEPTRWPVDDAGEQTDDALRSVLAPYGLPFGRREAMIARVNALADAKLAAGYPAADGLHVDVSDSSRADLGGMATTALGATSGTLPWPDSYKEGWITIENVRIPMPEPADGLMLAAGAGEFYAAIKQHARDLKDAVLAATDEAALDAIDIEAGWPG